MKKNLIKQWLLEGERRVYSIIIQTYEAEFLKYKPKFFRKWLADELDLPDDKINLSSINSAFARYKKSSEVEKKREKNEPLISQSNQILSAKNKLDDFVFSTIDIETPRFKTIEL